MNPSKHSFAGDELFRQIIEAEVDAQCGNLPLDKRHACILEVSQRLDAEIVELLQAGTLSPDHISVRINEEVKRAIEPGSSAA